MGTARFGKVLTAMVTPFHDDGGLDLDGAAALARWLVDQGNDGLVIAGTTGEAPTLSDDEAVELWRAVRGAVDVPILAGTGSNDTRHTIELSQRAAETGVDGLLVVSPYYNRPPQAGIEAPLPGRRRRHRPADRDVRRARPHRPRSWRSTRSCAWPTRCPRSSGSRTPGAGPARPPPSWPARPAEFDVYSGDDGLTLPLLAVGAVGVIGVATHWTAGLHAEMIAAHDKGDVDGRREINARLVPSRSRSRSGPPGSTSSAAKAAMEALGRPAGPLRLPLPRSTTRCAPPSASVLAGLGLARG